MYSYIARQPIFDLSLNVIGYELLYRAGAENTAVFQDGDEATRNLLSDAITVFGLASLTDGRTAYVNFTENLIMSDFVLLANPRQVAVEVLENTRVTERLVRRLQELKSKGYRLALDDYVGNPVFDPIVPMMNTLKVDFRLTTPEKQREIAEKYRRRNIMLLAEKVEDRADYERARQFGYRQFQGYFFQKPQHLTKALPDINASTYIRLLRELNRQDVDLVGCAEIIRTDATLTYHLLKKVSTLQYYRGNSVTVISQAVAYLGIDELYHWTVLMMARNVNRTYSDETVRNAYLRGIFLERLLARSAYSTKKSFGFLAGMFSLMEQIMDEPMERILEGISIPDEVKSLLLNRENSNLRPFLDFVIAYEQDEATVIPEVNLSDEQIMELYVKSIQETDWAFRSCL